MKEEEWAWVEGFEGKYQISSFGRVQSFYRTDGPRIKKGVTDKRGYVAIVTGGKPRRLFRIHRLVAAAFVPNPLGHQEVNHIDGVKSNNHFSNLEWCTRRHNVLHSYATGLRTHKPLYGEASGVAKLTAGQVLTIRAVYKKGNGTALAKQYGIGLPHLSNIVMRKSWKHI